MSRHPGSIDFPPRAASRRLVRPACTLALSLGLAASAWAQTAPTCNQAQTADCLYFPSSEHEFTQVQLRTAYTDAAGDLRSVEMLVRVPVGAREPMPVVVWSHGGAEGKESPATSMVEWSEATARAGYFTVSIAHAGRSGSSRGRLCPVVGIPDEPACRNFKYLNWDRPHDIRAVLEELARLNAGGPFSRRIDLDRIAVGGHSAGSGGAQTVAGAKRLFADRPVDLSDPRPIAFLAFSPQQPGAESFFDTKFQQPRHSWSEVTRPVLTATGDGDSTCNPGPEPGSCVGDTPFGRRLGFQRMPPGDKYQLYLHDADAFHTLFELNGEKCVQLLGNAAKCDEMVRWLSSTGLAFLDAYLRRSQAAMQWLQSDRIENASRGVAEWLRR